MDTVVICELSDGEPLYPVILSVVDEYVQVLLDLLVDSFRLAVRLGVVCC